MNTLFTVQREIAPPPFLLVEMGAPKGMLREGWEGVLARMHKRTTPKTFGRAKELHCDMSSAEAKLWQHLRAHRMGDVHFRNHTAPAVGAGGMPLATTS